MRVSYIGSAQDERGFMVGSHVFDATPLTIDEHTVEEGYFVTRKRPSEGIRLVYIPKDSADLEFAPMTTKLVSCG
jgi:hypothetical protein